MKLQILNTKKRKGAGKWHIPDIGFVQRCIRIFAVFHRNQPLFDRKFEAFVFTKLTIRVATKQASLSSACKKYIAAHKTFTILHPDMN